MKFDSTLVNVEGKDIVIVAVDTHFFVSRETICDRGDGYVSPTFLISKSAMHQKNTVASPRLLPVQN